MDFSTDWVDFIGPLCLHLESEDRQGTAERKRGNDVLVSNMGCVKDSA